VHKRNNTKIQ